MTDELRDRLARIDPMAPGVPTDPVTSESSRLRLEHIMSTPTKEQAKPATPPSRTWVYGIAAVAVLVLAVGGLSVLTGGTDAPPAAAPLELDAGAENTMASCIVFSPELLEGAAEVAFEGTVTSVAGETVTLSVDEWFRGGDAVEVVLHAPSAMETLIGGVPFAVGGQYLISAQDGTVNYCGLSGESTPELRAGFEAAFAQG